MSRPLTPPNDTAALDQVFLSIDVAVPPAEAFHRFTAEIDLWWRNGPIYRTAKDSHLAIEPKRGGRFLDVHAHTGLVREIGKVLEWEPDSRLLVEWRGVNFGADECTFVEVIFHPEGMGTRVNVRHYGLSVLAPDHPARHGQSAQVFIAQHARWWAGLVEAMQAQLAQPPKPQD